MYPGVQAKIRPQQPALIMAQSGDAVSYAELERRSNRLAHFLRASGLGRHDHYAIFMENNARYVECCSAGERAGLYYTCINSYLTPEEVAYIIDNSESKILITSTAKRDVALQALAQCPRIERCIVADGSGDGARVVNLDKAVSGFPDTPIADESLGAAMLYSSGTTGRPKGILRPLPDNPPAQQLPIVDFITRLWRFRDGTIHLSPAPLYHTAPLMSVAMTIRAGGTAVIMEHFDPEQFLALVERYRVNHSVLVPTMFSRMLKLPDEVRRRYDISSLEIAIHGAAPCPMPVKEQMIAWWGPIIHEYYAGTEDIGSTYISPEEWLAHPGSVGRPLGECHILDADGKELAPRECGVVWFAGGRPVEYHNDPDKTASVTNDKGWRTLGDIGYLDEDGYLYLTDRQAHMIISGGVNIYPQEAENVLAGHPAVADVAVIGVPDQEMGEAVRAVVQPVDPTAAGPDLAAELLAHCRAELATYKCPRQVDFVDELPRDPNGKLYKRLLRERYWEGHDSLVL
ncbi:MAG TPA: AMP-binding protein [Acidimicrobiales bacterium]